MITHKKPQPKPETVVDPENFNVADFGLYNVKFTED